jgi:hypothetical protein
VTSSATVGTLQKIEPIRAPSFSGLNPRASIHLINCYVIPRLLYGLDVIQLSAIDVKNLNVYFNKLIKQILEEFPLNHMATGDHISE